MKKIVLLAAALSLVFLLGDTSARAEGAQPGDTRYSCSGMSTCFIQVYRGDKKFDIIGLDAQGARHVIREGVEAPTRLWVDPTSARVRGTDHVFVRFTSIEPKHQG